MNHARRTSPLRLPRLLLAAAASSIALCIAPSSASAISVDFGSTLARTPMGFGCDVRPLVNQFFPSGSPSCTWFFSGPFGVSGTPETAFSPGNGTIRTVTVRSGDNPAPLQVVILRQLTPVLPNGQLEANKSQCCFGQVESGAFQPAPNTTTTVTVNLPVQQVRDTPNRQAWVDIIGISGVGPGTLPVAFSGNTDTVAVGNPGSGFLYPAIHPGHIRTDMSGASGFEVLARFNFCDGTVARGRAGRAGETGGCATAPPPPATGTGGSGNSPTSPQPSTVAAAGSLARNNRAAIVLDCPTGGLCRSRVRLFTRTRPQQLLGTSGRVEVPQGTKQTVSVLLNARGRRLAATGRPNRVIARIDTTEASGSARVVTLRGRGWATFFGNATMMRAGVGTVRVRCGAGRPCSGSLRVMTRTKPARLLAQGALPSLRPGATGAATLRLTAYGRNVLKSRKAFRGMMQLQLRDGYRTARVFTLRRP